MSAISEITNNPDERKVLESLADPKWDYRTIDGIQRSSGLAVDRIRDILRKYDGQFVRRSSVPDAEGRELYTLQTEGTDIKEFLRRLRTFISKSV